MATMKVGSLVVDLVAESAQYVAELKKANDHNRKFARDTQASFKSVATSVAGLAAGYLGLSAVIAGATQAMANAKEIENMARTANMSVEAFQAAAYAADQYGISAEKLADISKDVADKLGDFISVQGGEFKDFFEQVAPKVGLTAKELQGLSGPEVLIAVKKAMDDANLSMEEQITYLEKIGNDSSLLRPLLEDNGKAWRELGEEAHEANLVLSQTDITALRESEKVIKRVSNQISTSFAHAVAQSAEQIEWLGTFASNALANIGDFMDSFSDKPMKIGNIEDRIDETREAIVNLKKELPNYKQSGGGGIGALWDVMLGDVKSREDVEAEIQKLEDTEKELMLWYAKMVNRKKGIGDQPEINQSGKGGDSSSLSQANQQAIDSLAQSLLDRKTLIDKAYKEEIKQIEQLVYDKVKLEELGYKDIETLQADLLKASKEKRKKALEDIEKEKQDAQQRTLDSLTRSLATEAELIDQNYKNQVKQINSLVLTEEQIRKLGYDSLLQLQSDFLVRAEAQRQEAHKKLKEEQDKAAKDTTYSMEKLASAIGANTKTMEHAATSWANSFSSELANVVTKGELDFGRLAESIINDLIRISIQANITSNLLDLINNSFSSGAGDTAKVSGELATGGPVMKGSTYLVGEKGPELFTASNSGNIVPNNQLGSGTTVNVYTQPGETAETKTQSTPQGDVVEIFMKQVDSRMNEQISRGQGIARTLESRYALSRKSY